MQLLFDFFPLIVFFVAYKFAGIFVATGVIIAAVLLQTAIQWLRHRKVSTMALVSAALVLVFGGLTLWIHDEAFIKWKVTVVNWLFAAGFLISQVVGERPMIQRLLDASVTLERPLWLKLNTMWALFFLALGFINLYVMYNFSTDTWAKFKVFGVLGLTVVFALAQGAWLTSKLPKEDPADADSAS
ncbi:MAG TPA: septation protein A [Povalibacter sp.]|nr:septation protein A [Povalibacter sp.]